MSLSLAPFPRICSHLCPGMCLAFLFISTRPGMKTWTRSGPSLMLWCHLATSEFPDENKIDCKDNINVILFMDCLRKQTHQCAQHKLKIVYKTRQQKHWGTSFFKENIFLGFHGVVLVKTFPLMYQLLLQDWYWRSKGDFFSRGTDRQKRFWNPHMETCRHTKNFNSKLKISG